MIDLDEDSRVSGNSFALEFLEHVYRDLVITRRMSETVRVRIGQDRHDFRITYLGPSRSRREARRPG